MGKSASGKDTVFSRLIDDKNLSLERMVPYTTRPMRSGETDGVEYHFTDIDGLKSLRDDGKVIDASNVKSGDVFWLEVNVKPTKRNMDRLENIAINQILPSGWEIENLRVTDSKTPKWVEEKSKGTTVSYTDIRDDRVMWFFNYGGSGELSFFAKLNAVTKGEYDFPGTVLEAMYDESYRAYKKGNRVKVN